MVPHRVANLTTRGVGDLLGEPARPKPRLKDPFDGARIESAVLRRVLDRGNDVVDGPRDLCDRRWMIMADLFLPRGFVSLWWGRRAEARRRFVRNEHTSYRPALPHCERLEERRQSPS